MLDLTPHTPAEAVLIETRDGLARPAHLPCSACGSREWLYYADGSRKVQCHGCQRLIGYDLSGKRSGRQPPDRGPQHPATSP